MAVRCLVCKQQFRVPAGAQPRDVLVTCPHCGFIGLWNGSTFAIATHTEEASLERQAGEPLRQAGAVPADDATAVDERYEPDLPLPYKRHLFVKVLTGPRKGESIAFLSGRAVIGRQGAEIAIDDPKISRKHAAIEAISRENIFLRDLMSTNGTWLNGARVRSKKLRNGDVIRVGSTELQFLWQDDA